MSAAVYRGEQSIVVESVPTPTIGPGEILIQVESCGVCHTDLKKIEYDLLPPPRIFGHETAGIIAAVGESIDKWQVNDRVIAFHHIPCQACFYCERRLYAQCPVYKKVGITAGFEPAGGGFAQYVRVMPWVVERGLERIPSGISFDQACWVEPVNTCLKAVRLLALRPGDTVAVLGQGPIGLLFTSLAVREGAQVISTDTLPYRREIAARWGATSFDPQDPALADTVSKLTDGRGVDAVILAVNAPGLVRQAIAMSRAGARILLFAQTSQGEAIEISGADICVGERVLLGSYSADIDLQRESADLVFSGTLPVSEIVSHRVPLSRIQEGINVARKPEGRSLKVIVHPQEAFGAGESA